MPGLLFLLLFVFLVVVPLLILIGILIGLWLRRRKGDGGGGSGGGGTPGQICFPPTVNDQYSSSQLASAIADRLSGTPADGSSAPVTAPTGPVIWVDKGDEVLVHLESTQVRIQDACVLVSVDLESDQTGRQAMVVAFSLSTGADDAGLVAATDALPRGNGLLAARWGQVLQSAIWASLLNMSQQHAFERQKAPLGLSVTSGLLNFHAGAPLAAVGSAQVHA
ncbi:MAG: hypothetical protein WCC26_04130 [Terracidiphilus sp.]